MGNPMFIVIFGIIVFLYGILNYYIGLRGWQAIGSFIGISRNLYWVIFWCLSFSYIIGRAGEKYLPVSVGRGIIVIGANWLALMYYFILIIAVVDILRLVGKYTGILPKNLVSSPVALLATGLTVLAVVMGIWLYGYWNARNPHIAHYDVTIKKPAGKINDLHVVMVSDIHLGTIITNQRLAKLITTVNGLKPDVILFAGDIIDEDIEYFVEKKMDNHFRQLKSKYGAFAVLGNHEYIGRNADEAARLLNDAGVKVLRDDMVKVADSFYIVGRDDKSAERFSGHRRKGISELLAEVNKTNPIIMMDHQPVSFNEAREQGIDLMFSGHTHVGQLFPNQLITRRIYENDWGYLKKESLQVIVSSGFGTWGPPIRVGNNSEIVDVTIHFKQ